MFVRVAVAEIEYVEAARNYCCIHLADGRSHVLSVPMKDVAEYLPPRRFIRIHRSHIVNIAHVTALMGNLVIMACDARLSISREYRALVARHFVCVGTRKR